MKTTSTRWLIISAIAALLTAPIIAGRADPTNATKAVPPAELVRAGHIDFCNAPLSQALDIYKHMSAHRGVKVDSSQISKLPLKAILFSLKNTNDVTFPEALQLFEKAFYKQAGIVATHPDKQHVVLKLRSSRREK